MKHPQSPCNISKVLGHKIVTADGKRIGHVADLVLTKDAPYKVTGLLYGESGWEHRLHLLNPFTKVDQEQTDSDPISWDDVDRIEGNTIILRQGYHKHS